MASSDVLGDPLQEVEFLARSPNRVRLLDALTSGPIGRHELEEATDVSRATLGRTLDEFHERGWVSEEDRQYQTTQLGEYVLREFMSVLESFEPVPELNEVAQWFPQDGFGFNLRSLAGSKVIRSTKRQATAPTRHITNRIRTANSVRLIAYTVLPGVMDECWRGIVEGGLELESVLDSEVVEFFGADAKMFERAQEMFETGRSEVYVYDDDIPSTIFVVDDLVLLCLSGGEGAPLAVIETDDEAVRSWAESTIDDHRREGERVDPALFTA